MKESHKTHTMLKDCPQKRHHCTAIPFVTGSSKEKSSINFKKPAKKVQSSLRLGVRPLSEIGITANADVSTIAKGVNETMDWLISILQEEWAISSE